MVCVVLQKRSKLINQKFNLMFTKNLFSSERAKSKILFFNFQASDENMGLRKNKNPLIFNKGSGL